MMDAKKALGVLLTDTMEARWMHKISGKEVYGNSFSRNPKLLWSRPVQIIIDQQLINQTNKIIPLDGEYVFRKTNNFPLVREREYHGNIDTSEETWREEFVVGNIDNMHRYITAIILHKTSFNRISGFDAVEVIRVVREYSEKWGITLNITPNYQAFVDETIKTWNTPDDEL
jgi:hypothetical protein